MKTMYTKVILLVSIMALSGPVSARLVESAGSTAYSYQGPNGLTPPAQVMAPEAAKTNVIAKPKSVEGLSFWDRLKQQAEQKVAAVKKTVNNTLEKYLGVAPLGAPTEGSGERHVASEAPAAVGDVVVKAEPQVMSDDKTPEQKELADQLKRLNQDVTSKTAINTVSPGRQADATLPLTKTGVPTFGLLKTVKKKDKQGKVKHLKISVDTIPKLDVGVERSIAKSDFLPIDEFKILSAPEKLKKLESPGLTSNKTIAAISKKKIPKIQDAKAPKTDGIELGSLVSSEKINKIPIDMVVTRPLQELKPVNLISENDMIMISAIMLFEKGELCHIVSGLLTELSGNKEYEEESNFYLGTCAHQMGFHSEAVSRLLRVIISENAEFAPDAIANVAEDLPREYDSFVARAILGLKKTSLIPERASNNVHFILSRSAYSDGNYSNAMKYSSKVSTKSKHYGQAQFIHAISQYALNNAKESEAELLALREHLTKNASGSKELEALIAINLARMRFTAKRYQAAHEEYMKVPKDNPMWVQALIEQGWTQLSVDDPEGAIGNMYSLHSPYFKSVFMPESWVVRTIGYIDICQYGDAYRTLSRLEQSHKSWLTAVETYRALKKNPSDYYETVKNYLRGNSAASVDGLPSQIIREIARQRGFLNAQGAINVLEDEITQYRYIYSFIRRDQATLTRTLAKSKARLAKIKADLASIDKNPDLVKNRNEWMGQKRTEEQLVRSYTYKTSVYERARVGYLKMRKMAVARIESQKSKLRGEAGRQLVAHLKEVKGRMDEILEGNEFLRYEIFAGSGENIRYQVAGGQTADARRIPANVKPQKILNWEFDGEYWEDEIGSYRSSLRNNCPQNMRAKGTTIPTKTAKNGE